jgi:hypothetical protein
MRRVPNGLGSTKITDAVKMDKPRTANFINLEGSEIHYAIKTCCSPVHDRLLVLLLS